MLRTRISLEDQQLSLEDSADFVQSYTKQFEELKVGYGYLLLVANAFCFHSFALCVQALHEQSEILMVGRRMQ